MYNKLAIKLKNLMNNQLNKITTYTKSEFFKECINIINSHLNIDLNRFKNANINNINTILVINMNGIGDSILMSPFLRELRKNYLKAKIIFITTNVLSELFTYCPYINELIIYEFNNNIIKPYDIFISIIDFMKKYFWGKLNIDLAIIPHSGENNYISLIISLLSFAKYRIGYTDNNWIYHEQINQNEKINKDILNSFLYGEIILTHHIIYPSDCYHEILRRLYILSYLKCKIENMSLECWLNNKDKNEIKDFIKKYKNRKKITIGIGGNFEYKKYPYNKYITLMKKINQYNRNIMFFIVCGSNELSIAEKIKSKVQNTIIINFSLRKTIALMYYMDFYIGNDTAAAHMASLNKNIKIIEIFNEPEEIEKYYPHLLSSIRRFGVWHNKVAIIRPKKISTDINNIEIKIDDIFEIYQQLDNNDNEQYNIYTSE